MNLQADPSMMWLAIGLLAFGLVATILFFWNEWWRDDFGLPPKRKAPKPNDSPDQRKK